MRVEQHWDNFALLGGLVAGLTAACIQPAWAEGSQITEIRLNPYNGGLSLILETDSPALDNIFQASAGNAIIFDLTATQLQIPEGGDFRQVNPAEGIAEVTVTPLDTHSVRVRVVGTAAAPDSQIEQTPQGIVLNLIPQVATAQPEPEIPSEDEAVVDPVAPAPMADADRVEEGPAEDGAADSAAPLRIVVTATRSEAEESDVTRSLTVITREQIEQQSAVTRNLGDILGQLVPGLAPGNQSLSEFGQSLRGRNPLVLIDGVPQSTNRNAFRNIRIIDPSVVERIEVLRGPTALYGDGATGGIINIITRPGGERAPEFSARAGLTGSLSEVDADSLGGILQAGVAGGEGEFDYRFSGSFERIGSLFDAEGDRIPPDQLSTQGSLADTNTLNLFGKLGWESDDHRLQFTINHFNTHQDTDFITDPSVNQFPPGDQKARARAGLELDDQSAIRNTFLNLDYRHPSLFWNSRVHAQLYYRDYLTRFFPFDGGRFGITTPEGFRIFQSRVESEEYGARLELETPLIEDQLTLLTGLDYADEDSVQPVTIFDNQAFDASDGLVFNQIGDRPWVPPLNQGNLGLFAQLQWQPLEKLLLRGGVRHERIGLNVDTFTTLDGNTIPGGELNYDATLFNLGLAYNLTDQLDIFADYAQGFSIADVGLVLRGAPAGFSVETLDPEAQRVDSYEIGLRGSWDSVQASLAGFYNESNLGTTFDRETLEIVRAPERVYGVEAAVDARLSEVWQIGSTLSFVEGENDVDDDGDFRPLTGFRIPPIKWTAYVENETLPGWRNRLQLLYSGGRDRAFNEGVDFRDVDDYVVLDLISSLALGDGTLQLGIQNLLNEQYFTAPSQLLRLRTNDSFTAASGRTFFLRYAIDF